jgi:hypothetical protein
VGEVFLQAEELLFCLLFLSRKKVRAHFEAFFLRRGGAKNTEKPVFKLLW